MIENINKFNGYFKKLIGSNIEKFGIIFNTGNNNYFYDTGTGKVLQCNDSIYALLKNLFENNGKIHRKSLELSDEEVKSSILELKDTIDKENIFGALKLETFNCIHTEELEKYVGKECKQIILELTEKCNLRCKYCIYSDENSNFRSFGHKNMSFETAKKAMDYVLKIADTEKMALSFYGGEPLINFDLMNKCIKYFKKNYSGDFLVINFTSNLTLLTEEMAKFLLDNEVSITCSLDGDKEIHNINRPYIDGRGSFEDTIKGLKLLISQYGSRAVELININMVVDAPYTIEKFENIQRFFDENSWLPQNIGRQVTYAGRDSALKITDYKSKDIISKSVDWSDELGEWTFNHMIQSGNVEDLKKFSKQFVEGSLIRIHKRYISNTAMEYYGLNGCCVPGGRKIYVTVDGNLTVCERVGSAPNIGNVDEGLNMEAIKKNYVDKYIEMSKTDCDNCWASHLCSICYSECYDENGLNLKRKKALCEGQRYSIYKSLERYHTILEKNPELLNYINQIEMS